jgi:hypothetical protein
MRSDDTANSASGTPNRFNIAAGLKGEKFRAAELGLHPITLARARAKGELGFIRLGDRVLYGDEHITAWLQRNERPALLSKKAA